MSLVTRGLGGPAHALNTFGLGGWVRVILVGPGGLGRGGRKRPFIYCDFNITADRVYILEEDEIQIESDVTVTVPSDTCKKPSSRQAIKEKVAAASQLTIDGETYTVIKGEADPTEAEIELLGEELLNETIEDIKEESNVSETEAHQLLRARVEKELKAKRAAMIKLQDDDIQFLMILFELI